MLMNPYMINTGYQQPMQSQSQIPNSKFAYAMGEAGAQAYPVQPGETVAIFDSTAPVLRMKTVGMDGKPLDMEVYDMIKRETPSVVEEKEEAITKDEIITIIGASVKKEVEKAISELSLKPTPKKKKGEDD